MTAAQHSIKLTAEINDALAALHNALNQLGPLDEERIARIHTIAEWAKAMENGAHK